MKTYFVVGAGRSGINAAKMLLALNENVILYDGNENFDVSAAKEKIGCDCVDFVLGNFADFDFSKIDICVVSPGVSLETPVMKAVAEHGIPIWGEVELAYRHDKGTVIGITGTNGKTTTTSLTYEIVKSFKEKTLLVGNIEIPYTGYALQSNESSVTVAEISSFQLETMVDFKPHISAILNITPDHLDRHKTLENYIAIKESITKNQNKNDFCVLNYNDTVLRRFGEELKCKVIFFSAYDELESGVFLHGDTIIISENGDQTPVCKTDETSLVGLHNYENIMAAVAMTHALGVPLEIIREGIRRFTAVEHRIEFVAEKNGVKYYNDSKGTNPDAAIKAVCAMPSPTVLIGGGYDKKSSYDEWVATFDGRVKELLLIGKTKHDIAAACDRAGFKAYKFIDTLEEAVSVAAQDAQPGDCVLLSPACASWDMFKSYQQRGTIFKDCVKAL